MASIALLFWNNSTSRMHSKDATADIASGNPRAIAVGAGFPRPRTCRSRSSMEKESGQTASFLSGSVIASYASQAVPCIRPTCFWNMAERC